MSEIEIEFRLIDHKKYKTVRELLQSNNIRTITSAVKSIHDLRVKEYIIQWLIENKISGNNLSSRVKSISSPCIVEYVLHNIFLQFNSMPVRIVKIFETTHMNPVHQIHEIHASTCGTFIDYLVRRIISEIRQELFNDSRMNISISEHNYRPIEWSGWRLSSSSNKTGEFSYDVCNNKLWWFRSNDIEYGGVRAYNKPDKNDIYDCGVLRFGNIFQCIEKQDNYMKINHDCRVSYIFDCEYLEELSYCAPKHKYGQNYYKSLRTNNICCSYPVCKLVAHEKTIDTFNYRTIDILPDIFVSSLSHSEAFLSCESCLNARIISDIYSLLSDDEFVNQFISQIDKITSYLRQFLQNKKTVLLNPALGGGKYCIPADCDIVIDDVLIDIKCTVSKPDKDMYELLQLLGYSALLQNNPTYNMRMNELCILNLLEGNAIFYDCQTITAEQYVGFLEILNHKSNKVAKEI